MLHILYGSDAYARHEAYQHLKAAADNPDLTEINSVTLDGNSLTMAGLQEQCSTLPFIAPQRLVRVDGLLSRFESSSAGPPSRRRRGQKKGKGLGEWAELPAYVSRMPESTVLVLVDGDISRANPLLQALSRHAKVRTFNPPRGAALRNWIVDRVSKEGASITPRAAELLADLVGGDLWTLSNELEKLLLFTGEGAIDEHHVRELTVLAQETNIFALVDAVAGGDSRGGQTLLRRLYRQGAPASYILTMLARQFRLFALASELPDRPTRRQIHEQLGLTSEYAIDKTLAQARHFDLDSVRGAYDRLLKADRDMKTGRCEEQTCLELLVTELATYRA
ncbi:MAG: DNA polymerase III subunit delta [Chloroflexota bacterium]